MGNLCVNQCCSVYCWVGEYDKYNAVKDPEYKGSRPGCCPCASTGLYMSDPSSNESLTEDARLLYKAMKGLGTRESDLIRVLANRTQPQLERIKEIFKEQFDPNTEETAEQVVERWIKDDTSGDFKTILLGMMKDRAWTDAKVVKQAIDGHLKIGAGTIDTQLIEIFTTRTPADLRELARVYEIEYGTPLIDDIKGDTSFRYQDTLIALLDRADYLAMRLNDAMIGRPGTDNMRLIRIMTSIGRYTDTYRGIMNEYDDVYRIGVRDEMAYEITLPSMNDVKKAYEKRYGHTLAEDIYEETSMQFRDILMVMLEDPAKVLSDHIHYAIDGLGTEDSMLIELLTCHSNKQLVKASKYFEQSYGKPMAKAIQGDTSGNYSKALSELVSPREYVLAKGMRKAMEGMGTDDYRLMAGFTGKSRREIFKVKTAYEEMYDRKLEDDIRSDTSFWYRRSLTYMLRQATEPFHWMAPNNLRRIRDV